MKQIVVLLLVLFLIPLTASAQDFCEGNFDYDDDQDGTDAFTFKTDFGRHQYNNSCPPDGPAPVPQTGLRRSDSSYDDGYFQCGTPWPAPRFLDKEDGSIRDNLTGLRWLKRANCLPANSDWNQSIEACATLNNDECDLTDGSSEGEWRLPNVRELHSLIDYNNVNPALPDNHLFEGIHLGSYWSSTPYRTAAGNAFRVQFSTGNVYESPHTNGYPVLCVNSYIRFTINGDGTVTDNNTGLVWLRDADCFGGLNWSTATSTVANLSSGQCGLNDGSTPGDWRLPTIDELTEFSCPQYTDPPVCNTAGTGKWQPETPFQNVQLFYYFSSTEESPSTIYMISMFDGSVMYTAKISVVYVWPVRGDH